MATHFCIEPCTLPDGTYCYAGKEVTLTKKDLKRPFMKYFRPIDRRPPEPEIIDEAKQERLKELHQKIVDEVSSVSSADPKGFEVESEEVVPEPKKPKYTSDYVADFKLSLKGMNNDQLEAFAIKRYPKDGKDVVDKRRSVDKNVKAIVKREKKRIAELEN